MNQTYNVLAHNRTEGLRLLICQQVDKGCEAIHAHAETSAQAFYKGLASKIPRWVDGYRNCHHVDNVFKVKSQAKAYTEELVNSLQQYIKDETTAWAGEQFLPMVGKEIHVLRCSLNSYTSGNQEQLGRISVSIDIDKNAIVKRTTPSTKNKLLSTGTSLLIGDLGGAIMGGAGGSDAMLKTMGCEFAAGMALGIISLFTPVGIAALIGSAIASAFVGGTWAMGSIEKKIKKSVVESTLENLSSPMEVRKFMDVMHEKIECLLSPLRQEIMEDSYMVYSA